MLDAQIDHSFTRKASNMITLCTYLTKFFKTQSVYNFVARFADYHCEKLHPNKHTSPFSLIFPNNVIF